MSWIRMVAVVVICFLPATVEAQNIVIISNPQDDAVIQFRNDPKVRGLDVEVEAFRERMLRWQERDFRAIFGNAFEPAAKDYARMCTEPSIILMSGLTYMGAPDYSHTASYRIGDGARVDVHYGRDGKKPCYLIFYLKVDAGFVCVHRAGQLEKRVDWERAALWRAIRHTNDRWRKVVGWEVDPGQKAELFSGFDSRDPAEKLKATIEWAKKQGYTTSDTSHRWMRGDIVMAEVNYCRDDRGEAKPYAFTFNRPDGTRYRRDESARPGCILDACWYRTDGSVIYSERPGESGLCGWTGGSWCWYDKGNNAVRIERDTNGDGIPDEVVDWAKTDKPQPLPVEKSWAIHPELIPVALRIPDQPNRRIPVRKITREE